MRFVEERWPATSDVVLGGSTAAGTRTATSDVDLLVLGPPGLLGEGRTDEASTHAVSGGVVELFAYTEEGFEHWAALEVRAHRPVIITMLLEGRPLRSSPLLSDLRSRWRPVLEAGPRASARELDALRYVVTDLLDDVGDAQDPAEHRYLQGLLFERTAALVLLSHGRWLASGKHLPRALRRWNAARAEVLVGAFLSGEPERLVAAVEAELAPLGGRLQAGHVR
nr:nucleotidyltransferase domain-containing protein [Quadrisphaera sp. RL12-1S]